MPVRESLAKNIILICLEYRDLDASSDREYGPMWARRGYCRNGNTSKLLATQIQSELQVCQAICVRKDPLLLVQETQRR